MKKKKILIVDDEKQSLFIFEKILTREGYAVVTAENGVEALEKLKKETIDVIISDISMPKMDGFQLCKRCHSDDALKHIPFIFNTAVYTDEEDVRLALSLGADKFMTKPMGTERFIKTIEDLLKKPKKTRKKPLLSPETLAKDKVAYQKGYGVRLSEKLESKVLELEKSVAERKEAEEMLRAANQQLRATEQQLRAANQQLRATEQQLRAVNQQLRATEQQLRAGNYNLRERIKELNCLYGISQITVQPDMSLEKVLQGIVNCIPPGWQYPEITCARVILEDKQATTDNFKVTKWKQAADILIQGKKAGAVEVFYLEKKPEINEGPFLKEERNLINVIAVQLANITKNKNEEEKIKQTATEWRRTFDAIADFIFIQNRDFIITRTNNSFADIFGLKPEDIVGKKCYELLHKSDRPWPECPFERTIRDGKPHVQEVDDPNIGLPLLVSSSPLFNDKMEVVGSVHIAKDISGVKKSKQELERKVKDLERFHKNVVDRELKMIELKKRIKELEARLRMES